MTLCSRNTRFVIYNATASTAALHPYPCPCNVTNQSSFKRQYAFPFSAHILLTTHNLPQEKFRTGLLHSAEEFKKTVSNVAEEFDNKGPFTVAVAIADAMDFISTMRGQLGQLKLQESNIRKGLNIFKIDQPPSHIIVGLDKVSNSRVLIHLRGDNVQSAPQLS